MLKLLAKKKLKNRNIQSLKIIETKQKIYVYVTTQQRNIEKDELLSKE